ncbi:hypothetical protein [Thauera sinica]|uniref:Uncharacterized protein n=1 Tax=Thauera sinica TaxID=2665146 RepID=A0ABW1AUP1_9RHOO|nr:hypothetical protein [Thauera sp. K11]ATE59355.1 hypothetical protein CCZ27_04780 [Thauera sp. K11]
MSLSPHSRLHVLAGASMLLVLAGCVTINIYFPAAAAEKAADRIIDEVWQLREGQQPPGTPAALPAAPGAGGARP